MNKIIFQFLFVCLLTSCIHEDDSPVLVAPIEGAAIKAEVGGPAQPNQVWIDLSEKSQKSTQRDAWDLGFYCGDEFRVVLNSSVMMAVGKFENVYDIDSVTPQMADLLKTKVQVGNFEPNAQYIDDPAGNFLTQSTGIEAVSAVPSENAVYLVNMGKELYTGAMVPGSVYTAGAERGWKKIRVLREQDSYRIQFADISSSTHEEMIIHKETDYNFIFLNLKQKMQVSIQPEKKKWDLAFTVFTNLTPHPSSGMMTSYIFPDMVLHNTAGNVGVYQVNAPAGQGENTYSGFSASDIDHAKFVKNDQRTIGSTWRTTTGPNGAEVYTDVFYIVKDAEGFYFKLRFLRMKNTEGYRGYPEFEFKPL